MKQRNNVFIEHDRKIHYINKLTGILLLAHDTYLSRPCDLKLNFFS